jgi:four helix bundle protein
MEKNKQFDERYLAFGTAALQLLPKLPNNKVGSHLGDQLFRSATSIGAHLQESRGAESRPDFIHKLGIALKEAREARYWLALIHCAKVLPEQEVNGLLTEAEQIVAMLTKAVLTAKANGGHVKS